MSTKFTGRGGAGNVDTDKGKDQKGPPAATLATPTIKSDTYTTGRGGSGNMAKNDKDRPEIARAAQDVGSQVEGPETRGAPMHHGRGGAANVIKGESSGDKGKGKEAEKPKDVAQSPRLEAVGSGEKKPRSGSPGLLNIAKEGIERVRRGSSGKKETK